MNTAHLLRPKMSQVTKVFNFIFRQRTQNIFHAFYLNISVKEVLFFASIAFRDICDIFFDTEETEVDFDVEFGSGNLNLDHFDMDVTQWVITRSKM